jgi:putative FmdB family regulatory protein
MPLYEYRCNQCQHKVMLYRKTFSQSPTLCPHCGNDTLKRIFSTFSVRHTNKDLYDSILNDPQMVGGMMNNDPKALVEWNKRMSSGEPVAPEYEELVEKMERGELPTQPIGQASSEPAIESE